MLQEQCFIGRSIKTFEAGVFAAFADRRIKTAAEQVLHPSSAADAFQHAEFDQARQAGLKRLLCCFVAVDTIQQEKVMRIERRLNFPTYPLQELDKLRILYLSMKGERNLPGIGIGKIRQRF